ncbi:MAG: response regulator transcription factor [Chitinophagaceae bacterium]|nr:response regulator transcription factor [Chitinophagaceae bacterium]
MINILIADDHTVVRYGMTRIIQEILPEAITAEAENFSELLTVLDSRAFDLLVLDINMPGGNNLQMIDVIRLRQPQVRILIFSGYDEQIYALRCLQAGANGYLMKQSPGEDIRRALVTVLKKEKYSSLAVKQQLLDNMIEKRATQDNPLKTLTTREMEVLHKMVRGFTTANIAAHLNLQVSTVSTYKSRIFEKMGVTNIVELVEKWHLYSRN